MSANHLEELSALERRERSRLGRTTIVVATWGAVAVVILVGALLVCGGWSRMEIRSCHLCGNSEKCEAGGFLLWTQFEDKTSLDPIYPIPSGHVHDWYLHRSFKSVGLGGWIHTQNTFTSNLYKTGTSTWTPPAATPASVK